MGEALEQWRQRMEEMLEEELAEGNQWLAEVFGEWVTDFDVAIVIEELEGQNAVMVVYSELSMDAAVEWWWRENWVNYAAFRLCEQNDFQPDGVIMVIFENYPYPSAQEFILKSKAFAEGEEAEWPFESPLVICEIAWEELVDHYGNGEREEPTEVFRDAEHCTKY